MLSLMRVVAFLQRDLAVTLSYPMRLPAQVLSVVISTLLFFFIGKLVDGGGSVLAPYGGDYFSFVLVGVAFTDYLFVSVNGLSDEIRKGQMLGTLEAMLVTPLSSTEILVCSSLYGFLFTTLRVFLYLGMGTLFFNVQLQVDHPFVLLLVFALTITSFWGVGLLSASFVLVYKQASPINWGLGALSGLIGGVMFPVEMLPVWLKPLSQLFPLTYSLDALRLVLLQGYGLADVSRQLLFLFGFTALFMGIGLAAFRRGLHVARAEGTLLHY